MKPIVFCLPFAGGSSYAFSEFRMSAPDRFRVAPLDLPGHGKRISEPLLTDLDAMADDLLDRIRDQLDAPYMIFGHSMGALLAYLLGIRIRREALPSPAHLLLTGSPGPSVNTLISGIHHLPRDRFVERVMAYGGMPDEVAREPELMDIFVPILRADFEAVATWRHEPAALPLDVQMTVLNGTRDRVTSENLSTWRDVTTGNVDIRQLPGGHFFIFQHWETIWRLIDSLISCTAQSMPLT